jgi:hypothetical protein
MLRVLQTRGPATFGLIGARRIKREALSIPAYSTYGYKARYGMLGKVFCMRGGAVSGRGKQAATC